MDTPEYQVLYERGLEIRKQVVGEDYVANALEKGSSDFLRPLQQLATVLPFHFTLFPVTTFCTCPDMTRRGRLGARSGRGPG